MAVVPEGARCRARVEARASGTIAGVPVAEAAFRELDPAVRFQGASGDGDRVSPGDVVAWLEGAARSILSAERVALNFLTHLSGAATMRRPLVDACAGTET